MKWRLMQQSGIHAQGSVLPEGVMGSNGSEEFFPFFLLHKDPIRALQVYKPDCLRKVHIRACNYKHILNVAKNFLSREISLDTEEKFMKEWNIFVDSVENNSPNKVFL